MQPDQIHLFYVPKDRLRLTVGEEKSYHTVKPVWASPLTYPNQYLSLLDGKGDEIAMVPDPKSLSKESLEAVQEELRRRYLTASVHHIKYAKVEYGATYWTAVTDRGERDFVTQSLQENAIWLSKHHLLLVDVDGNRFEIPDVTALDAHSQTFIQNIL
jgi:hypothetical protein